MASDRYASVRPLSRFAPIAILLAVAAAPLAVPPPSGAGAPSVQRHEIEVSLDPEQGTLEGTDTMTIRPNGAERVVLFLAEGSVLSGLSVDGDPLPHGSSPVGREGISLPVPAGKRDSTIRASVSYRAAFRDPVPEDPVNTEDPSFGVRGAITGRGTLLLDGALWYPDLRDGGPSRFRVRVSAPEGIEAVTSGRLLERSTSGGRTVSRWETERPLDGIALSAGRYVVREDRAGEIPVYTYFYPETDPLAPGYLEAVKGYLALYGELFGAYPFEKFAVVENFFPTGYGFPSYTLLGSSVVRLPFLLETSLGHEIAHSWWGNGVLVDYSRGNWSEGLTTYVADYLYKERASPGEGREYRLKLLRDYATLVPPGEDFPVRAFGGRASPASRAVGYGKTAMIFHMARRHFGEEAFWVGLREVIRTRFGSRTSWDDFDRAFNRGGSTDPASFFAPWVERPGAPAIRLDGVRAEREGDRWRVTGTIRQEAPHYELSVPVRLFAEGGTVDASVSLSGESIRFRLGSEGRPQRIALDPDAHLFRRLAPAEIPPTVNGIRGSATLVVVATRGIDPQTLEASEVLFAAMGRHGMRILREEETRPETIAGRDVLYLGFPGTAGLLPDLPAGLSADPGGFTLEGTRYETAGSALFAALPHPSDPERVAAIFLARSPSAAREAARKIPHYGKYSYLVFDGGRNLAKGTWTANEGPTVHEFPDPGTTGTPPSKDPPR